MNDIHRLQFDIEFLRAEGDKYCLISPQGRILSKQDMHNQANFCILQTINAYKNKFIDKNDANRIINKIDALVYSEDMLGFQRVIDKLNNEIIGEELHTPHFNSICVICEELYDSI